MSKHILLSYSFDGEGKGNSLTEKSLNTRIKQKKLTWVHLDANQPKTKLWLEKNLDHLPSTVISALLDEETRPRMMQVNDGMLLILRGVNLNENATPEDMVSVRLWIDKYRIISIRKRQLKAIWDIDEKIKQGKAPKNTGDFLCMLVSRLFERMEPVLTVLDESTDIVEEEILNAAHTDLRESIVNIRKQAIIFRRYMAPQKEAIAATRMTDLSWLDDNHKRNLYENHNRITRYVEDLDAIRERAQIVKDELTNILADRMNKNMYVLSVIAAIFLPLGFLTGLLGINVGGIPGAEDPNAFYIFIGLLWLIVWLQILLFKRMKWF